MTSSMPRLRSVLSLTVNVARVGLGNGRESHLQAGAARCAFHFGRVVEDLFDVLSTRLVSASELPAGMM